MSSASDSQNESEQNVELSEGSSPNESYDEGNRSTPSNLPKAATRTKKKRTSDSEDEDFVANEATSKQKRVVAKEYGTTAISKPLASAKKKTTGRRVPTSKPQKTSAPQETMTFTIEQSDDEIGDASKKEKRARKTTATVIGRPSMREDDQEEEEEEHAKAPPAKAQKLMLDAMKTSAPSKSKTKPKAPAPKRSTRNIPATEKNKALVPENDDDELLVLRKLKPKIRDHDNAHPVAENMMLRKDKGLREWRKVDPYSAWRRTACDYWFHTREQQDFYETFLLDKKPIFSDMK